MARIQADSYDAPLDFNDGIRLDLGSTAKLRTLIVYCEAVEELHRRLSAFDKQDLLAFKGSDPLSSWARSYILHASDTGLGAMLGSSSAPSPKIMTLQVRIPSRSLLRLRRALCPWLMEKTPERADIRETNGMPRKIKGFLKQQES